MEVNRLILICNLIDFEGVCVALGLRTGQGGDANRTFMWEMPLYRGVREAGLSVRSKENFLETLH